MFSAVFLIIKNSLVSRGRDSDFTILIPLKEIGLCEAVIIIPPHALKCVVAQYTSSVPEIPISKTFTPLSINPSEKHLDNSGEDLRTSLPIITVLDSITSA